MLHYEEKRDIQSVYSQDGTRIIELIPGKVRYYLGLSKHLKLRVPEWLYELVAY